jgi:hypothetical protein
MKETAMPEPAETPAITAARLAWEKARAALAVADDTNAPNEIWGPASALEAETWDTYQDLQDEASREAADRADASS